MRILVIAGPNGAGKTTFARRYLEREGARRRFVNGDDIAARLRPDDPAAVAQKAGRLALREMEAHVAKGGDFATETTLSGRTYAKRIRRWRPLPEGCGRMAGVRQFRRDSGSAGGIRGVEYGPRAGHEVAAIGPNPTNHRCRKATNDRATLEIPGRGTIEREDSRRPRPRTEGRHAEGSRIRSPGSGGSGRRRR